MSPVTNHPAVLAILCLLVLWLITQIGVVLAAHSAGTDPLTAPHTPTSALAATLILLGFLIGMTLATTANRSAQRKLYRQQEAAAIRSAYIRAQLLPRPQSTAVRALLTQYLTKRTSSYTTAALHPDPETIAIQPRLWQVVLVRTPAPRIAASNLVAESLNTVLRIRPYAQRAWATRLSATDWLLLLAIAALACLLAGFTLAPAPAPTTRPSAFFILLPTLIATSFFFIATLDLQ